MKFKKNLINKFYSLKVKLSNLKYKNTRDVQEYLLIRLFIPSLQHRVLFYLSVTNSFQQKQATLVLRLAQYNSNASYIYII